MSITYYMTSQPAEAFRYFMVLYFLICVSFTAQAYGIAIGSLFELKSCLLCSSCVMALHILLSGFIVLEKDTHWIFGYIFETIYVKHAFYGVSSAIMGFNRSELNCNDKIYCHFQKPQKFLKMIGITENVELSYTSTVFAISFSLLHLITFFSLRNRLKN